MITFCFVFYIWNYEYAGSGSEHLGCDQSKLEKRSVYLTAGGYSIIERMIHRGTQYSGTYLDDQVYWQ
jgi:hypothetical protein